MSVQAGEGALTLQVILYGVQGELHLGWLESRASIIWSPLLPMPGREAKGRIRIGWIIPSSCTGLDWGSAPSLVRTECYTLSFVELLKDWMLLVILHWKLRHWWPWSCQKARCCGRWLCWKLGKSVLPPWNPSECWPWGPCAVWKKVSFSLSLSR